MTKQICSNKFRSLFFGLVIVAVIAQAIADECGQVNTPQTIAEGNETHKSSWPFAVAVYEIKDQRCFCGGTLISRRHVLTAAHCVLDESIELKYEAAQIAVIVGAFVLGTKIGDGMKHKRVSEVIVHPDWDTFSKSLLDADVAILVLRHSLTLTHSIQIVCLPSDDDVIDNDAKGYIVRWDLLYHLSNHSVVQVVDNAYCYPENPFLRLFQSSRIFCGGAAEVPFTRELSGGGFFISDGSSLVQHGILVSVSNATGNLTGQQIAVLINVAPFKNWIVDSVRKSGEWIGEAVNAKIILECNFVYLYDGYVCEAWGLDVQSRKLGVAASIGAHKTKQSNANVELLQFHNGTMFYLVDGIGKLFPNLKSIFVGYSQPNNAGYSYSSPLHTKFIKRSNFQKMENLLEIAIHQSDIETIPEDLLWDLPNLSRFQLDGRLANLPERTFEKNPKLTEVYLASNALKYLPRNLFKYNLDLKWVNFAKNALKSVEIDFMRLPNVRYIFLAGNSCIDKDFNRTTEQTENQYENVDYPQVRRINHFQRLIYLNCTLWT